MIDNFEIGEFSGNDANVRGWPRQLVCLGGVAARGCAGIIACLSQHPQAKMARMRRQRIFDDEKHAHFVTFSCYRRRRLLDHDRAKQIVSGVLDNQLRKQSGCCAGLVIMPDHVHAVTWFPENRQLCHFMKPWKQRSSANIRRFLRETLTSLDETLSSEDPLWQRRYYDFNIYSESKLDEKLQYMRKRTSEPLLLWGYLFGLAEAAVGVAGSFGVGAVFAVGADVVGGGL